MYDDRTAIDNPIELARDLARQLKGEPDPAIIEYPLAHFRHTGPIYREWLFQRLGQEMAMHGFICSFWFEHLPGHLHYILLRASLVIAEAP